MHYKIGLAIRLVHDKSSSMMLVKQTIPFLSNSIYRLRDEVVKNKPMHFHEINFCGCKEFHDQLKIHSFRLNTIGPQV
jgi:hypothetical protein